jgi:hypothetical protein
VGLLHWCHAVVHYSEHQYASTDRYTSISLPYSKQGVQLLTQLLVLLLLLLLLLQALPSTSVLLPQP